MLGVPSDYFVKYGAVSRECAEAMAVGIRERLGADIGVSITGIAGPGNDSTVKDVGTVFVALSSKDGVWCRLLHLGDDRIRTRTMAANHALDMVRRYLTGLPIAAEWDV